MDKRLPRCAALPGSEHGKIASTEAEETLTVKPKQMKRANVNVQHGCTASELLPIRKLPRLKADVLSPTNQGTKRAVRQGRSEAKTLRTQMLSQDSIALGDIQELADRRNKHLDARATEIASIIMQDVSKMAIRPNNLEQLEESIKVVFALSANSFSANTLAQDHGSNWRWWAQWCAFNNTPPIREYIESRSTPAESTRERYLWTAAIPWILVRMKPGPGRKVPQPNSAVAVLRGIRRIHRTCLEFEPPPSRVLNRVMRGLMNRYAELHGPEALRVERTKPIPHMITVQLTELYGSTGRQLKGEGAQTFTDAKQLLWKSVKALSSVHKESGLRKAETTTETKKLTKCGMSMASCRWHIGGDYVSAAGPTKEQLENMQPGMDFVAVTPPPSKSDQWGRVWGHRPIFMSYDPSKAVNAATDLRDIELSYPVTGEDARRNTPLFRDNSNSPLTGSAMDKLMVRALITIGCGDRYSWHGYRASLACSLLKAGRTNSEIMALCRWQTEDSLLVYATMDESRYSELLNLAYGQDISTIRPVDQPVVDEIGIAQQLSTYNIPESFDKNEL